MRRVYTVLSAGERRRTGRHQRSRYSVGLATEIGGILAHGSIVAREYGIPAVMGVNGATQRIKDGQMITVDGDRGVVVVMD